MTTLNYLLKREIVTFPERTSLVQIKDLYVLETWSLANLFSFGVAQFGGM